MNGYLIFGRLRVTDRIKRNGLNEFEEKIGFAFLIISKAFAFVSQQKYNKLLNAQNICD